MAAPLTVGVEEEFLLVDPVTRAVRPQGPQVAAAAAGELGHRVGTELTRYQVEGRTSPHTCLSEAAEEIRATRAVLARAAAGRGLRIASSGSPITGLVAPVPLTPGRRYAESLSVFRALDDEQSACACHVHVGVADPGEAIEVSNHLRPWLPTLTALAANSPYWNGRDTGYASWRTTTWGRWPVAGPPPYFDSTAHFQDPVEELILTRAVMDHGGLYWDIRPSHHLPTIEVRVADAGLTPEDTVLLAAVIRALVATALGAIRAGEPAPRPAPEMLRAACWRAARDGLAGQALDPVTRQLVRTTSQVERMLRALAPALRRSGDLDLVRTHWDRLRTQGSGADRQRAAYRHRSSLHDVVDHVIDATWTSPTL
ncbi:YbdK family carboxylate-amine ligase [Streptomyces misionensis]|uniref:Putative glutamate--cysteine ligase 2 n=2 Tax=Streptomyces misionensis TaxID=67331 RepID=A0A5C6J1C8_9ACTN|nr:YbdK family carboxylate-amine ligase [Streptomyces misionensis]